MKFPGFANQGENRVPGDKTLSPGAVGFRRFRASGRCSFFRRVAGGVNAFVGLDNYTWLFRDPDFLNSILNVFGIANQPFLTSPDQAMYVIMLICCWKGVAYWMMFLLAGLQSIDGSFYEAGRIDGTNFFTGLFHIILPMLKNSLVFVTISDTMINLFMFVPVYLLTGGGPQGSTNVLMYEAYRSAFKYSNYGRSYAIITILLLISLLVTGLQFRMMRERPASSHKASQKKGERK